jgi:response regulator RpfG family c-di-GMP phosphodiesterase
LNKDIESAGQQRVLVVDDEDFIRDTLSKYLTKVGYILDTANDGRIAIEKLESVIYDLVITDLRMPNLDGRELLKFLTERFPEIPKIVLTGFGNDNDILFALKNGASDFLVKPISDLAILRHSVQKALQIKKNNDDKKKYLEQLKQIYEITSLLNEGKSTDEIFKSLAVSLRKIIPYNRMSLLFLDNNKNVGVIKMVQSDREIYLKEGHEISTFVSDIENNPKSREIEIINDLENSNLTVGSNSDAMDLLRKEGMRSLLRIPLIINNAIRGSLTISSVTPNFFQEEYTNFMELIAGNIALSMQRGELIDNLQMYNKNLEHLVEVRTNEILKTQRTTLFALSKLAEVRDRETGEHLERLRRYSVLTAQIYKYTDNRAKINNIFIRDLYDSSILHDIGKVGIPDSILRKAGPLTPEEREIIKQHILIGYDALKSASRQLGENSFLKMAMDIILYHHEHWDGTGYPNGLKGEDIPLAARIITISDVYDALVSKRPYKDAYSHEQAIEIMKESSSIYDPVFFRIFIDNQSEYNIIRQQFLDK